MKLPGIVILKPSSLDWRYWRARLRWALTSKKEKDKFRNLVKDIVKNIEESYTGKKD